MGRAKWKELTDEQIQTVIDNYVIKKQSLATCGKEFGLSQKVVETLLKDNHINKRTYTEARQEGRKYSCNDNFFKYQNSDMAYILGLIASDGNVAKKENLVTIELLTKDKEILEKIREKTKSTREIKDYVKSTTGQETSKFCVWSKNWKDDLGKYGIFPNKTFTLTPPLFLDNKFFIDYLRGYFDGDGTIYKRKYGNAFEIVGASKPVILWMISQLANVYGICANFTSTITLSGTVMYKLNVEKADMLKRLYNLLYDTEDCLYLKRKKENFNSLVNISRDSNTSVEV